MVEKSKKKKQSLTHKTLKGFVWNFMGTGFQAIVSVITVICLARLLTPEEFGLVGSAMLVINFLLIFCHIGIGAAIIQFSDLDDLLINTAFTIVCFTSSLIFLILQLFSDEISILFIKKDDISSLLQVLSFFLLSQGIGIIPGSLLRRKLKFQTLAKIKVVAFISYSAMAITTALSGLGFLALAMAHLTQSVISTLIAFSISRHRFRLRFTLSGIKRLLNFGIGFSLGRIGNYAAVHGDKIIVANCLGVTSLGIYERAYQLVSMPAAMVGQILDEVLFPSMAKVQDDNLKLRTAYGRGLMAVGLVMIPLSIMCFVLAELIVLIILGEDWRQTILPLRILSLGMFFRSSYKISDSLARALGAVYHRALRQWIFAFIAIFGAWVGSTWWGLKGAAMSMLIALITNYLMMGSLCLKKIEMTWFQFIKNIVPGLSLGVTCGGVAFGIVQFQMTTPFNAPWNVVIGVVFAEVFVLVSFFGLANRYKNEDIEWVKKTFLSKILKKLRLQ